jgi:transcriptional regulator with XRE-family HTH domain
MDNFLRQLGPTIRSVRLEAGLTQAQVAEMVDMPLEAYVNVERGRLLPAVDRLKALCRVLWELPSRLLSIPSDPPPRPPRRTLRKIPLRPAARRRWQDH